MAYIGRDIQYGTFTTKQTLTADSSTTVFTLTQSVADANNLLVSIGGVIQEANTVYTASGTVLTFTTAPVTGDLVWVVYLGKETTSASASRDSITYQTGVGDDTTTPFALSSSVSTSSSIILTLNGVEQVPGTDFTASGTVLTFTTAPSASDAILIYYIASLATPVTTPADASVTTAKLSSGFSGTLPAWNGGNLTGTVAKSLLDEINTNIALVAFLRSTDHNKSVLNMMDAFIDQFEDQTNVDDTNSVNETYNATGDYYGPTIAAEVNVTTLVAGMVTNVGTALGGFNAALLIDGTQSTGFHTDAVISSGGIVHIDLGADNKKTITSWQFYRTTGAVAPTAIWTIAYSDDNSSWTDVFTGMNMQAAPNSGSFSLKVTWTADGAHRYWRSLNTVNGFNGANHSRLEIWEIPNENMTLISEPKTADASPDTARVALFNEETNPLTMNTDVLSWVSRSKQTFTSTNATNILNATTHGLVDTDRVMVISSAADLPLGLDSETVYYVVTGTTSTLQVSLTSGGAAVTFSDDGTGTHSILAVSQATLTDQGDFDTGKATLSGTADISGQPTGTDMTLVVQTKNNKDTKLHGMALQYR